MRTTTKLICLLCSHCICKFWSCSFRWTRQLHCDSDTILLRKDGFSDDIIIIVIVNVFERQDHRHDDSDDCWRHSSALILPSSYTNERHHRERRESITRTGIHGSDIAIRKRIVRIALYKHEFGMELAERMRQSNQEQFHTLVRMHLSFELDLHTDE